MENLRIFSLNVNEYQNTGYENEKRENVYQKINELILRLHPDIICLQEGHSDYKFYLDNYEMCVSDREHPLATQRQPWGGYFVTTEMFVKKSLKPIFKKLIFNYHTYSDDYDYENRRNEVIVATIQYNNTTIDIANVYLTGGRFEDKNWMNKIDVRNQELETILKNSSVNPLIIIGDFNSPFKTPIAIKTIHKYAKKLDANHNFLKYIFNVNSFVKKNKDLNYLFKIPNNISTSVHGPLVVDYALATKNIKVVNASVIRTNTKKKSITDHNGILLDINKRGHKKTLKYNSFNYNSYYNTFDYIPLGLNNPNVHTKDFLFKKYNKPSKSIITMSHLEDMKKEYISFYHDKMQSNDWKYFILFIRDIISNWDPKDFLLEGRLPVLLKKSLPPIQSEIDNWSNESGINKLNENFLNCEDVIASNTDYVKYKNQGVLNMPLKYCGTHIILPKCLENKVWKDFIINSFGSELAIRSILEHEPGKEIDDLYKKIKEDLKQYNIHDLDKRVKRNPRLLDDYVFYITVQGSMVEPNKVQRNAGMHVDGFQGTRYPIKFPNDHSYLYVNEGPTQFTDAPYHAPDNYNTNWYEGKYGMNTLRKYLKPGTIKNLVMMSGMQIHEAGKIPSTFTKPVGRVFYRGEFVLKNYDRNGDSINSKLGKFKYYTDRSISSTLKLTDTKKLHGVEFGKKTGGEIEHDIDLNELEGLSYNYI
jgi:exonuclease III